MRLSISTRFLDKRLNRCLGGNFCESLHVIQYIINVEGSLGLLDSSQDMLDEGVSTPYALHRNDEDSSYCPIPVIKVLHPLKAPIS